MILRQQLIERHWEQRALVPTVTTHKTHNENARNLRCGHCLHQAPGLRVFLHRLAGPGFLYSLVQGNAEVTQRWVRTPAP
jgi:hypothetical protein